MKCPISLHYIEQVLEICAVQLETNAPNSIILSLHRSPHADFNQLIKRLNATLKYLYNSKSEFVILGDINIDYLSEDNRKRTTKLY
jgi:hypothetical protein